MRKFTWRSLYKPLFTSMVLLASAGSYAQYCIPSSSYGCGDQDDINSFSLTGENGTSFIDLNTGCSTDGYADKTTLPAVNLGQGISYPANISSEYSSDYAAVWIDFNNNSTFESTESVDFLNQDVGVTSSTINLAIPPSAALGNHRMRVLVYYPGEDLTSATVTACNDGASAYEYGETQDYTINVVVPPACPSPLQAVSSDITASSVTLSWQGTGSYIVEYGPTGFVPGTGATAGSGSIISPATSPITVSNLAPLTTYDFYIRHDCSATSNGYSSNAAVLQVKTNAVPPFNDLCSGATALTSGLTCNPISGTTSEATTSGDISSCETGGNYADVWYSFVATHTEHNLTMASIKATNPDQYDSYFGITFYTGTCGTLSSEFGCQYYDLYQEDSTSVSVNLTSLTIGQTYYLRFWKDIAYDDNYNEVSGDLTFNVCITDPPPASMETKGDYFVLERSRDAKQFTTLASIVSHEGASNYSYEDKTPFSGDNFYRLKIIGANGNYFYSNIVNAKVSASTGISAVEVYPNPTSNYILLKAPAAGNGNVKITDISGKNVYQAVMTGTEMRIDMRELAIGCYLLHYDNGAINRVIKVDKQ